MLFYTKRVDKKNVIITSTDGKELCKFKDNKLETDDKKLISLLKNKNKYPWIFWDDEKVVEEKLN